MPVFAKTVFHGNAQSFGLLMGSSGVGALAGAMSLASRRTVPGTGRWIMWATFIFGLGLMVFSQCHQMITGMAILILVGFGMMVQLAGTNTVLQTITDDDKRGRVMSFYTMAFMVTPFGGLLAGWVADKFGSSLTVLIGGLLTFIAGGVFALQLPKLRGAARAVYVEKGILPPEALDAS
jgi:MFS family permease